MWRLGGTWDASFDIRARLLGNAKVICGDLENFDFSVIFGASKVKIWQFLTILKIRLAENDRKIKIFKIPAHNFFIAPKSCPDTRISIPSAPSLDIFGLFSEILVRKMTIFPTGEGRVLNDGTYDHLVPRGGWVILTKSVSFGVLTAWVLGRKLPIFRRSDEKSILFWQFINFFLAWRQRHVTVDFRERQIKGG